MERYDNVRRSSTGNDSNDVSLYFSLYSSAHLLQFCDSAAKMMKTCNLRDDQESEVKFSSSKGLDAPAYVMVPE